MSIYATLLMLAEPPPPEDAPAPIAYRASNRYPDPGDRYGYVEVGMIPGHVAPPPQHYDPEHELHGCYRPFLRLGLLGVDGEATVVLDAEQVRRLRRELSWWLRRMRHWEEA